MATQVTSARLSIVITCHRFLQRLRVSMRNWCAQDAPAGSFEILVADPHSPDGTREYLATVARAFPELRVVDVAVRHDLARNKGALTNHAVEAAAQPWVWLADADCVFPTDSVSRVLAQIEATGPHLYFGRRRHLGGEATDALIVGRRDAITEFDRLTREAADAATDEYPWGYTQIVPRDVIASIRYTTAINSFARSDEVFLAACRRRGLRPRLVPGLECLHLAHPFVWHANTTFL
ncbi:glycosyltransferase family 2 protein [Actinoplanes sp. CA-051413]|uniref:glycosyltransferase family 2 protein n=1 Tax=Actinoplanes sp. CA-051413 TaxID=3239899 RepID=UPI003D97CE14